MSRSQAMVHSYIEDNWMRVEIMHGVARGFFEQTHPSDFRDRQIGRGDCFPFDATAFTIMQQESSIVGMVMAWSVVTLECLLNHALAEQIPDIEDAKLAIGKPDKYRSPKPGGISEPAFKLMILLGCLPDEEIIRSLGKLTWRRNAIVHDKPFYIDPETGEVEHFNKREIQPLRFYFDDLPNFYQDCDLVRQAIIEKCPDMAIPDKMDFLLLL